MSLELVPIEIRAAAEEFIRKYKPKLTVDNFHSKGLKFEDELGHVIVFVPARTQNKYLVFTQAQADVFVLVKGDLMLGWVHRSALIDAETEYMIPVKALNKMPRDLKFAQECRHMAYHGGVKYGEGYFSCLGCGMEIVDA